MKRLALAIVAIFTLVFAFNTGLSILNVRQKSKKVYVLKEEVVKLEEEQMRLKKELEFRQTKEFVEQQAKKVSQKEIINEEEIKTQEEPITAPPVYKQWLTTFFPQN